MQLGRQHVLLVVFGVVVAWALWLVLGSDSSPGGGPRGVERGGPGDPLASLPRIVLDPPDRPGAEFRPSGGRNLFAYGQPKPVAASRPPAPRPEQPRPPQPPRPPVQQAQQPTQATPPPPPKPTPPPVNFDFIGYVGPRQSLIGVFSVRTTEGEEIVLAGEGEVLAEKFRVHRIGYEEVEVGYTEDVFANERKVLPMGGGRS